MPGHIAELREFREESGPLEPAQNGRPARTGSGKKARKRAHDRNRYLDSRERCRNLWEVINQARNLVELADHKARYALVVMGVVNAAVFILATRSHSLVESIPPDLRSVLPVLIVPFGLLAVVFLIDAYNSLRPRPPVLDSGSSGADYAARPTGLIFWETFLSDSLASYQKAWDQVRMVQLNSELAAMAYRLAEGIHAKYAALRRLYIELLLIILIAALLLAIPTYFGLLRNGAGLLGQP
jgi:hypothetical protein